MNQEDFVQKISDHAGIIQKVLFLYVDDPAEREDLKQEILVQAWSSVKRFKGDSSFSTWLYRVALNTVLTFNKKRNRLDIQKGLNKELVNEEKFKHPYSDQLFSIIKSMNSIDKTIITLHLEDYDNGEIADVTGLSKNNVNVKLHRIKKQISERLKSIVYG